MSEIRQILLQFPSLRAFLAEYGARMSSEGMLLRVESPPATGSTVDVEVVVAEGMRLLRARGEILWQAPATPDGGQQAAVRFRQLDDASRTVIRKIVDQRRREGAETFRLDDVPGPREARLRDLTVPAAMTPGEPAASDRPADGSVFDLAAPPVSSAADLFDSSGSAPPTATPEPAPQPPVAFAAAEEGFDAPPPAERARPERRPAPPVPLLADPEVTPFDLGPPPVPEVDPAAAAGRELEPEPEPEIEAELSAPTDLSELFGGDQLETAPAQGRTEAFPPSFLDEVEAELEAAGSSQADVGAHPEVDAEEPVAPGGASLGMAKPELDAEPAIELEEEPAGMPSEPETAADTGAEADAAGGLAAAIQPPPAPPADDAEAAPDSAEEVVLDLPAAEETVTPPPAEEAAAEPDDEPTSGQTAPPSVGSLSPEASPRVADAVAAEHGPETVEIPIVAPPPAQEPAVGVPPPVVERSPADASAPPAVQPPPAVEPPAAPIDDNLLSIPELSPDGGAAPAAAPEPPAELPSSAQALRGAASRSRHVGTWLLIALLVAALGVAGYFLLGLVRGGDGSAGPPQTTRQASAPDAARPGRAAAPSPAAPSDEVESPAATSDEVEPPGPSSEAAADTPPAADAGDAQPEPSPVVAEPPPADAGAGESTTPLSGLNRITWSETDSETILALIGDGEMLRRQIDTISIGGAQPRLVIKISGVERAFQPAVLEVGTSHVRRVRTGLQAGGGLHVVVDLTSPEVSMLDLTARGARVELRLGTG